jgi:hypothetical protein
MTGMRPCDEEMLERLRRNGNPLGWTPHSRDAAGNAIMVCLTSMTKATYMKITPQGLYYDTVEHHDGRG